MPYARPRAVQLVPSICAWYYLPLAWPTYVKLIGPNLQSNLQFFQAFLKSCFFSVCFSKSVDYSIHLLIYWIVQWIHTYLHLWYLFFDSLILSPNLFSRNSTTLQTFYKKTTMHKNVHDEWILRVVNFLYKFTAMLRLQSQAVNNGMTSFLKEHSHFSWIWIFTWYSWYV